MSEPLNELVSSMLCISGVFLFRPCVGCAYRSQPPCTVCANVRAEKVGSECRKGCCSYLQNNSDVWSQPVMAILMLLNGTVLVFWVMLLGCGAPNIQQDCHQQQRNPSSTSTAIPKLTGPQHSIGPEFHEQSLSASNARQQRQIVAVGQLMTRMHACR